MGYIYKITNNINGKSYIGKTERTIEIRWKEHLRHIASLQDRLPLYKAMAKYGKENFIVEQIEQCDNSILDEREIYWINKLQTYGQGYNCTGGSEGGIKDYHEDIDEIIARYQAGERLDKLCKEYKHDYASIRPKIEAKGVKINTNAGPMKLSKKVAKIDKKSKEIIKIYPSISEAARDLQKEGKSASGRTGGISRVLDKENRSSGGYEWKTKISIPNIEELYIQQEQEEFK